jgi:hypothetical protein
MVTDEFQIFISISSELKGRETHVRGGGDVSGRGILGF